MIKDIQAHALKYFKNELDYIQDSTLQGFFYNVLAIAPQSFHDDEKLLEKVKKAYHILRGMLADRRVEGAIRDALLGTVLICDILSNEYTGDEHAIHTVAVRNYLKKHKAHKDIQHNIFENIMRAVEAHEGSDSLSPVLEARPGTAEAEIATAFAIAKLPYIKVDWEVLENGEEDKE